MADYPHFNYNSSSHAHPQHSNQSSSHLPPPRRLSTAFGVQQHGLSMLNAPLHGSHELKTSWDQYFSLVGEFVELLGNTPYALEWGASICDPFHPHWSQIEESTRHTMHNRLERAYSELARHGNPSQYRRSNFVLYGVVPPFEELTFGLDMVLEGEADANAVLPHTSWFNNKISHQLLLETVSDSHKVLTSIKDDICVAAEHAEEECEHLYEGLVLHWGSWTSVQQTFVQNLFINILSKIKSVDSYHEFHPETYRVFIVQQFGMHTHHAPLSSHLQPHHQPPSHHPMQHNFSQHQGYSLAHSSRNISGRKKQLYGDSK
ncbi:hypothetical protein JCM5353_008964 [Sporobolomyces roseus]